MARGLMVYPMGGTIDGRPGDHVLLAPPFVGTPDEIDAIVERLGRPSTPRSRRLDAGGGPPDGAAHRLHRRRAERRAQAPRDHPRLPLTPASSRCAPTMPAAGASMLHVHVRDAAGRHSLEADDYRAAIEAIRARVGDALLLQLTSEAGGRYAPAEQMRARAGARAASAVSLAMRELLRDPALDAERGARLVAELAARQALMQYIVYGAEDLARCIELHADGAIPQRVPNVLFVLGAYVEQRAGRPAELLPMLAAALPAGWPWSACAFGATELALRRQRRAAGRPCAASAFENNIALRCRALRRLRQCRRPCSSRRGGARRGCGLRAGDRRRDAPSV